MAKKRKPDSTGLDEVDRTMYTTFCSAANSLSQLYTQAQHQQKLAFQAGERHGMEKLYQWILRQHEEGSRVTATDIVAYLQNELEYGGEDTSMSPRSQFQHQNSQQQMHFLNSVTQVSSGGFAQATALQGPRSGHSDQNKNSVFSNALSSPIRRSLQPFHLAQGGYCLSSVLPTGNGGRRFGHPIDSDNLGGYNGFNGSLQDHEIDSGDLANHVYPHHIHQNRDANSFGSNDSSMDMHEESLNS